MRSAKSHVGSSRKRLQTSFDLKKFQRIGSHVRGTAIKTYSDLDFLAVLARNEAKWGGSIINSDTLIRKVSQDLNDRFFSTTIRKDKQAVVAHFGGGQKSLDIVPGIFHQFRNLKPVFHIPDGFGGWMETSPEAHNSYFKRENARSGEKLRRLGQLVRVWKHSRESAIPISSFFIDLFLAQSKICIGAKSYPVMLYEFFKLMSDRRCRGFRDPAGVAGVLQPSNTTTQREVLHLAIEGARRHAASALIAEDNKKFKESNRQWSIVFNQGFI